jgi:amidase
MTPDHVIPKERSVYAFSHLQQPVLEVEPGAVIRFETSDDTYARLAAGEPVNEVRKRLNPVTGPVFVRGAERGDALRIDILDIHIERAWAVWLPGSGPIGDKTKSVNVREIPCLDGELKLSERLSVPLDPMIGCIGVAPKKGSGSTLAPVGRWGGNMDLRELRRGVSLLLPIFHPGALFSLGDLHAAMGRGEPCLMAIEASGAATVRLDVVKQKKLDAPRILFPDGSVACVGIGQCHDHALASAVDQAYDVLIEEFGLEPAEAFAYAAATMELRLGGPASPIALAVVRRCALDRAHPARMFEWFEE